MPTALRHGPYRVYFFSNEGDEPPHVHVERGGAAAKYWLGPVRLAWNAGFPSHELTGIRGILIEHESQLQEAWDEHFSA